MYLLDVVHWWCGRRESLEIQPGQLLFLLGRKFGEDCLGCDKVDPQLADWHTKI